MICFSVYYEWIIRFHQKMRKLWARNTSKGDPKRGPEVSALLASTYTHHRFRDVVKRDLQQLNAHSC